MRPAQRSLKRVHLAVGPVTASVRNASVSKGPGDSGTRMEIAAELVRDVRSKDAPKLAIGTAYRDPHYVTEAWETGLLEVPAVWSPKRQKCRMHT